MVVRDMSQREVPFEQSLEGKEDTSQVSGEMSWGKGFLGRGGRARAKALRQKQA